MAPSIESSTGMTELQGSASSAKYTVAGACVG